MVKGISLKLKISYINLQNEVLLVWTLMLRLVTSKVF